MFCALLALGGCPDTQRQSPVPSTQLSKAPPAELFRIRQPGPNHGSRYGFIDRGGRVIIEPRFDFADDFSEGLAQVWTGERAAFIKPSGEVAFWRDPNWHFATPFFHEGLIPVNVGGEPGYHMIKGGKWGYLDTRGRFAIEPQFTGTGDPPVDSFSDGLAAVRIDEKWGFIDRTGRVVVPPRFDRVHGFAEGLVAAQVDEKWGFIDRNGKTAVPFEFHSVEGSFSQRLAWVTKRGDAGNSGGFIDKSGNWVIHTGAAGGRRFSSGLAAVILPPAVPAGYLCPVCTTGVAGMRFGDRCGVCGEVLNAPEVWGFIDRKGLTVIEPRFSSARPFSEGLAAVQVGGPNGPWGFIDRSGRFVIPPRFVEVIGDGFRGGLAALRFFQFERNGTTYFLEGYIDATGKVLWQDHSTGEF